MKTFLLSIAILCSIPAISAPILCSNLNGKTTLEVNNGWTNATLKESGTIVPFGDLNCSSHFTMEVRAEGRPLVSCKSARHAMDAGYAVYIFQPRTGNHPVARVTKETFAGRVKSELSCVAIQN